MGTSFERITATKPMIKLMTAITANALIIVNVRSNVVLLLHQLGFLIIKEKQKHKNKQQFNCNKLYGLFQKCGMVKMKA